MSRILKIEEIVEEIKKHFEKFESCFEAIVVLLHTTLLRDGFVNVLKNENGRFEKVERFLPEDWKKNKDSYCLHYTHPRKGGVFLIKLIPMGNQMIVHGLMVENPDVPYGVQLRISDFLVEKNLEDLEHLFKEYQSFFTILRMNIVYKFVPELQPPQQQRTNLREDDRDDQRRPNPNNDNNDPLRIGPVRRPPQGPEDFFNSYGVDDLAPMGSGGFGNIGGSSGFGGFVGGGGGGGGMLFGPNNFMRGRGGLRGRGRGRGRGGRGNIPPNARYDPIFGIPDDDHLRPPRGNDDDDNFFF